MAIQIETGGIVQIEAFRKPLDPKILGGLAIDFVDNAVLHVAGQRLENYFLQIRDDQTKEFGACIAYGIQMPKEDEELLTKHLVNNAGASGETFTKVESTNGLDLLWAMRYGSKHVALRRAHAPIVFDNGDVEETGTIFSINAAQIF